MSYPLAESSTTQVLSSFVDRDMFMHYMGGAVGHCYKQSAHEDDSSMDVDENDGEDDPPEDPGSNDEDEEEEDKDKDKEGYQYTQNDEEDGGDDDELS